jgi:DNA-3-methyladenine glycosylase I
MFQRQPWMQRAGEHPPGDKEHFALLARAIFSAGLGPKVVESRWEGLRTGFQDFDPRALVGFGPAEVERLLADPGVIRNRRKIEAVLANATVFLELVEEHGSFADFLEKNAGVEQDFEAAAALLTQRFTHLGRSSAAFFLFSCGWRQRDEKSEPEEAAVAGAAR